MSQLSKTISQFWGTIQTLLFPWLEEELLPLTDQQRKLVSILEMVRLEEFVPSGMNQWMGRPIASRRAIARAFIAKCVYGHPTTRALHKQLLTDRNLHRICGWESGGDIPSESTFSRAFAEFSEAGLLQKAHETMIKTAYQNEMIGHISRDSTAIEGREKASYKKFESKGKQEPKKKRKKGRPKKEEVIEEKDLTRIQKQARGMSLQEMIHDLPVLCNKGAKKNSKGFTETWNGYKLHIDTADNGVPISAILTSAALHDSQAAIPLAATTAARVVNFYDLMDSAYDVPEIKSYISRLNHVPIIDISPRRDVELKQNLEKENKARRILNWCPAESLRYNHRSSAERTNARLKDEFGGRSIRVRGNKKVFCHLMIGLLVLTADQLLRIASP